MKSNIVKLYINDKEYSNSNELSSKFYMKIINWCNNDSANFGYNAFYKDDIYIMQGYKNKVDAENLINNITYPIEFNNIHTNISPYYISPCVINNINMYSFNIETYCNYTATASTGSNSFVATDIPYIGLNAGAVGYSITAYEYNIATINTTKLTYDNTILRLYPAENIKISWTLDFSDKGTNSSFIPVSNINGIQSKIHDDFRYIIRSILCPQSITGSFALTGDLAITKSLSSTTANASYIDTTKMLNIGNILLYESTVGAYKNTGNQISSTSYSIIEFTKTKLDDYKISVKGIFKNNSSDILLGSILLSGYALDSNNKAHCPISWVTSKDLWGVEQRTWHTNEVIELNWILDLTPSNQTIKPIVADINHNLSTL